MQFLTMSFTSDLKLEPIRLAAIAEIIKISVMEKYTFPDFTFKLVSILCENGKRLEKLNFSNLYII